MKDNNYEIPENVQNLCRISPLLQASEAVVRLDEMVKNHSLFAGWRERLIFDEACACQHAQNELVTVEELVLLDAGARKAAGDIPLASALRYLAVCRNAFHNDANALLRDGLPGAIRELADTPTILSVSVEKDDAVDPQKLQEWRRIWRTAASEPPLLHAALAWDAWHALHPERFGAWRAMLIASLVLKARGVTHDFLAPLESGQKLTKYRRDVQQPFEDRIHAFFACLEAGAKYATSQFLTLKGALGILELHLRGHRKNSRLRLVAEFLLSKPAVSIPMIAESLDMTQRGAAKLLAQLGSTPREITTRDRYRLWRAC